MPNTITPFLWLDDNAEEAMNFYVSVFPNSRVGSVSRYGDAGPGPKGSVMTASCVLDGQELILLNGGPQFKLTEAVSFVVHCETQQDVDRYWNALLAGGGTPSRCGWLKDRFGLSWQVVPQVLTELLTDTDKAKAGRAMQAMLGMAKIDIAALRQAAA